MGKTDEMIDEFFGVEGEFRSGLTWRSIVALLYSLFVFSPAVIYLNLVTIGGNLGTAIEFATLFLFAEIAEIYGSRILPQEAAIIFGPATVAGSAGFLGLIYNLYFVRSPLLAQFGIDPNQIPTWFSPPVTSPVWELRTFMHPDWLLPIIVLILVHITSFASGLFFGLLARELFLEGERLTFPMEQITVTAITTFSRREKREVSVLSWCTVVGLLYGSVYYIVPAFTKTLGVPIDLIPKPWIDVTPVIERFLPGGALGIATSLTAISAGMIIPQELLVVGIVLGSILRFLVINPLLVLKGWSDWGAFWVRGMNLTQIYHFSQLYFWLNPLIGVGFAVGLVPLIIKGKTFIRSMKNAFMFRLKPDQIRDRISGSPVGGIWMIITFSIGCIGALILDLWLIPDFPIWPLLLYEIVMPFLVTLSAGRMYGLAGTTAGSLSIPYFNQLVILASGYPKISAWFLPLRVDPGTGWLRAFKICQLTKTTIWSWIKTALIAWPLSLLVGFFYVQVFWQMAPIPSEIFPTPAITWPISIMERSIWITRPKAFFNPEMILYWGVGFGALIALFWYLQMPFVMFGIAGGLNTPIPVAISIFVGLVVKRVLERLLGKTWVLRNRAIILAGIVLGEGLAAIIAISMMSIGQATLPTIF